MSQEIVVNKCFGGFGLSESAIMLYAEKKGITLYVEANKYYKGYNHYYTNKDKSDKCIQKPPTSSNKGEIFL